MSAVYCWRCFKWKWFAAPQRIFMKYFSCCVWAFYAHKHTHLYIYYAQWCKMRSRSRYIWGERWIGLRVALKTSCRQLKVNFIQIYSFIDICWKFLTDYVGKYIGMHVFFSNITFTWLNKNTYIYFFWRRVENNFCNLMFIHFVNFICIKT